MARDESKDIFVTSDDVDSAIARGFVDASIANAEHKHKAPGDVRYMPASQYEEPASAVLEHVRSMKECSGLMWSAIYNEADKTFLALEKLL